MFRDVFVQDMHWATLVPRIPASGVLKDDPELIKRILSAPPKQSPAPR